MQNVQIKMTGQILYTMEVEGIRQTGYVRKIMWYAVKEDMKSLSKAAVFGRTHKNNTKNTKKQKPNLVALTTSGLEMERAYSYFGAS